MKGNYVSCLIPVNEIKVLQKSTRSRWRLRYFRSKPTNCIREMKITVHMIKDHATLWKEALIVCTHAAKFGGDRPCGSGNKWFLIYHVTSDDHVFKELCNLMSWSFLYYVTTLRSLLAIGLVVVVIQQLKYFKWPCKTTWSKDLVTLWKGTPHCIFPHSILLVMFWNFTVFQYRSDSP